MGMTIFRINIYYIGIFNCGSSSFTSVLKIYRFKLFKKTTKFKRYNRGLTRFIINRKKYVLRKKRTSLQYMVNLTYFWTQSYQDLRNFARFSQSLSTLEHSLTLTNKLFTKKAISDSTASYGTQNKPLYLNLTTLKKTLLLNNSLYRSNARAGFLSIFRNTQVGIVNFPLSGVHATETLNFGVLTDFKNNYVNTTSTTYLMKPIPVLTSLYKRIFNANVNTIKAVRKVLVLLILMIFRNH